MWIGHFQDPYKIGRSAETEKIPRQIMDVEYRNTGTFAAEDFACTQYWNSRQTNRRKRDMLWCDLFDCSS